MLESAFRDHKTTWGDSFRLAYKDSRELYEFLGEAQEFDDKTYPVFIPQKLADRIKAAGHDSPLWKQFVPSRTELNERSNEGLYDPIGDSTHSKGGGIIHRYKNRILFSPTTICPVNCRYCFRKNELAAKDEALKGKLHGLTAYLDRHPEVNEVILTGGDPLMISDAKLRTIISSVAGRVKYLRLHTRTPVIMPERITPELLDIFALAAPEFSVLSLAVHANHADEFTAENKRALEMLSAAGVQLLSQSVLLRGVNDGLRALVDLYETFAAHKVKAYYLHHPDRVMGAMGFCLPLEQGRRLYAKLRDELPGWAIPHYVIDPENGQGKNLAYNPESLEFKGRLLDRFNRPHPLDR